MTFTAIHRVLGVQPQPLTWEMIVRAVEQGVTEQPDLDWKAVGYGAPNNEWDELAKDVAAMANSGGGLIVIGVREQHQTAAALRLETPATLSDPEENSYRREIFSRTHPPVQGVSFERIRGVADDEQAVAIHVPASLDAPHLIYKDRQRMLFACPFRDGTGTNWMAERQLEAAYRQRFAARTDQARDLQALYDDTAATFDPALRANIVALARPDQPRPATLGRLDRAQVRIVFEAAHQLSTSFITGGGTVSSFTDVDLPNPRPGLRRHSARSTSEPDDMSRQAAIISMHDDGSIALAWTAGGFHRQNPFTVPSFMLERAAIDIAALIGVTSRALGIDSGYSVEIGVTGSGSIAVLSPGWGGTYENAVTTPLRRFQPVRLSVPPQPTDNALLATAHDIALDCVSQAGIANLTVVRPIPD